VVRLPVGEDIAANAPEGKTPLVRLRIRLSAAAREDQVNVTMNGEDLGAATPEAALGDVPASAWFTLAPPVQGIRSGNNLVGIRYVCAERLCASPVLVDRVELIANYGAPDATQ
jgi:hypothetical protein